MERSKSKQELSLNEDDSNMVTHSKTEFIISGFPMTPFQLTKAIGIEPSEIYEKGKITDRYKQIIKENSWVLNSGLGVESDIQTQITALLDKLRPYKNELIRICNEYPPSFVSTVRIYGGDRPSLDLSRENIKELYEYNAEFGIDIYIFDVE